MKLSKDLTLVLLRANGTPRTFHIPLPKLKRNLFLLASVFIFLLSSLAIFSILYVKDNFFATKQESITEEEKNKLASFQELSEEIAKLQATLEDRKKLTTDTKSIIPISLLGPNSSVINDSPVQINKPLLRLQHGTKDVTVEFELQNKFPDRNRVRGYIVILAKTPNGVYVYPEGAFSPDENILLNFAKGETFAISRFRSTIATFPDIKTDSNKVSFQIFIFSSTGQILNTVHIQEGQES